MLKVEDLEIFWGFKAISFCTWMKEADNLQVRQGAISGHWGKWNKCTLICLFFFVLAIVATTSGNS